MMNITVIAESTPGPVAINCATYVGYKKGKLTGAILATLGVAIPSFVIIFEEYVLLESDENSAKNKDCRHKHSRHLRRRLPLPHTPAHQ